MFKEVKVNARSLSVRRLVHGVGMNDADYKVTTEVDGKKLRCNFYAKWAEMLRRCYSESYQKKYPTYIGCSVDVEWHLFSNFRGWMMKQDWKGKQLDKDILKQGNKLYSANTCIFVTNSINSLLLDGRSKRGELPQGVDFRSRDGKFRSSCRVNGKINHLGVYSTPDEAHEAYKEFKYSNISDVAKKESDPLRTALLSFKIES